MEDVSIRGVGDKPMGILTFEYPGPVPRGICCGVEFVLDQLLCPGKR